MGRSRTRARSRRHAARCRLAYAAAGWAVLPVAGRREGGCGCRHRDCENPAKHPLTRHGVHDATADPVLIREWWRRSPSANVGIAMGAASGLVVVDVDLPRGGRESLRVLQQSGRQLPPTLTVRTGGGGLHLFYLPPRGRRVPNAVARLLGVDQPLPGIDLRGDGGYVVAPPSVHASGGRYRWRGGRLAPLPAWAWPPPPKPRSSAPASPARSTDGSAYGLAALAREVEEVRSRPVGYRNDGLNKAAFCLGRLVAGGELAEHLVVEALLAAALASGLGQREAERTIRSGLTSGEAVPRRAPTGPHQRRASRDKVVRRDLRSGESPPAHRPETVM